MGELMLVFFAGFGIFTFGLGAVLGALAKMRLLKFLAGGSLRVRWSTIVQVTAWEVLILFFSIFAFLYSVSSEVSAFQGHAFWFIGVLSCCSTILYCVFAVIPNMYLLGKINCEAKDSSREFQRLGYAALLTLPTPLFSFTLAIMLYASAL